jgi:pimeloyl-ACP methyl ester carboxylesterase
MRPDELEAVGVAAGRAFAGTVDHVQATHRAIARRVFGATDRAGVTGGGADPVARAHDGISDGIYAAVRTIGTTAVRGLAKAATVVHPADDGRALADRPAGDAVLGALNGAFGARFAEQDSALELRMTARVRGRDLDLEPGALSRAFPLPSGRVAVLVHGLCMTDAAWEAGDDEDAYYARRLHRDLAYDVVSIRYNSGRRIPANGQDLATLLERLSAAWPGGIRDLALIGHSMGGLVCRSACAAGVESGHGWIDELNDVVTLGTPHLGANLERASATVSWVAGLLPETKLIADLLDLRSDGVLDLRDGAILHDDRPLAVDRWPWGERGTAVPLLEGVRHHAVGVTMGRDPEHWLAAKVLGDLLVTPSSAASRARGERRLAFEEDDVVILGGLDHFALLHHERVYEHVRRWLRPAPALPAAGGTGHGLVEGAAVEA